MAALSAQVMRPWRTWSGRMAAQITDAATVFAGGFISGGSRDHGTAANRGTVFPYTGAAGEILLGIHQGNGSVLGAAAGTPPLEATLKSEPFVLEGVAVGGSLAGTFADNFRLVYLSNDNDLTLTQTADPVGMIVKFGTGSVADVLLFGAMHQQILQMAGGAVGLWHLGVVTGISSGSPTVLTTEAPFHGRILATHLSVIQPLVGAGADVDLNLEIATVNVTGGVINWVLADAIGTRHEGTAVTAANVFHRGDAVQVELAETTAATAGLANVYATVIREPGL